MRAGPDAGVHMSVPTGLLRGTAFTSRGLHPKRQGSFCSFGPTRKQRSRKGVGEDEKEMDLFWAKRIIYAEENLFPKNQNFLI